MSAGTTAAQSRVLVVDDDPDIREVLGLALEIEGYEVRTAVHGADALEQLGSWRPNVILLDLMMPVMDGWTFRSKQLELDGLSRIPVVVLSAAHEATRHAEVLGAAAVLPKPFDLTVLANSLNSIVAQPT